MPHRNGPNTGRISTAAEAKKGVAVSVIRKVLMNVSVQGSVGCVQVLVSLDSSVADLIMAVVLQYVKERRRPLVSPKDASHFDLHFSAFTLDCLDREEKLATLGSRSFFMCKRKEMASQAPNDSCNNGGATSSSCSKQAEKETKPGFPNPWLSDASASSTDASSAATSSPAKMKRVSNSKPSKKQRYSRKKSVIVMDLDDIEEKMILFYATVHVAVASATFSAIINHKTLPSLPIPYLNPCWLNV
ncbi:hypothetical protein KSS87_018626 [Heliosperma pusillum]|nr:hypothetical protein KSS87_018626 [Heliosperma pusillum]